MEWQNQPGSSNSPRPANTPYPGQPGTQFPSQPDLSPGGYPGQPISGQAAPIPPEVSQAAERAELGVPTREFNRGAGNASVTNMVGGVGGLIGIIGGVGGLLVGVLVPLLVVEFPLNFIIAGAVLVFTLPFVFFFRRIFKGSGVGRG